MTFLALDSTNQSEGGSEAEGESTIARRSRASRGTFADQVTLYASWFCPFAQRVWIALEELGVDYIFVEVQPYLRSPDGSATKTPKPLEQKRREYPEFVEASPKGLAPGLVHGETKLHDSAICLAYVSEAFPDASRAPLMPPSAAARARARLAMEVASNRVIPNFFRLLVQETLEGRANAQDELLAGLLEFSSGMAPLSEGPFYFGASFSCVDILLAPFVPQRAEWVLGPYRGFTLPEAPEFARLRAWAAAVMVRPSVVRTLVSRTRLLDNYSAYAGSAATSAVAPALGGGGGSGAGSGAALRPGPARAQDPKTLVSHDWRAAQGTKEQAENQQGAVGASINGKRLSGEAPADMSFLMHAAYGMENFPNYLLKWPGARLDRLLQVLDSHREEAARAKQTLQDLQNVCAEYRPLHPTLRALPSGLETALDPAVVAAISRIPESLESLDVRQEGAEGVFSFPLLRPGACAQLCEEAQGYLRFRATREAAEGQINGALRERLVLAEIGLESWADALFERVVRPLARRFFPGTVGELDVQHSYTVGYGPQEDSSANVVRKALIPHVDDSEVTLNVCLDGNFQGGELTFHGSRSLETSDLFALPQPRQCSYRHILGRAIMHLGQHFHEVGDVTLGSRHVLIMWCRSWGSHRARTCPCCLKFNRPTCICDPAWN